MEITRLDTPLLNVTLAPVADLTSGGTADEQNIEISGPSSYEGGGLQSRVVRINASGPSITRVRVSERLDV